MVYDAQCLFSALAVNGLRLKVRLGCSTEERRVPQYVRFDIRIRFGTPPSGCINDALENTICHSQLSDQVRRVCEKQEYQLIERLNWEVFSSLKKFLPVTTHLWLQATKENPPIPDVQDGTGFTLSDWPIG